MKKSILFLFLSLAVGGVYAKNVKVNNPEEFKLGVKQLNPGDSLIMAKGIWKDANLTFTGKGSADYPIYLMVENIGETILEGASCLRIGGEYLHVSGLIFKNGTTPRSTVIEFKVNDQLWANHCTLSHCVIDNYNKEDKTVRDCWVGVWGQYNKIEYCYFGGKTNQGTTFIVWPNGEGHTKNYHHIYRNYFGYRPPLGGNGGETMRIGTSHFHREASNTIVEENFFERCNGEVEIISIKSGGNRIINNTFFECEGTMTLRHGNDNEVSGNFFYGNNKPHTGGVRIINQGHRIFNNFFYQLKGVDFRAPLVIMNGIPNTPDNGYLQVKDVTISNNTFVDCTLPFELCVGAGERDRTLVPQSTTIENNVAYSSELSQFVKSHDDISGIRFNNNVFYGINGVSTEAGCIQDQPYLLKAGRFEIVYSTTGFPRIDYIRTDILGRERPEQSPVGAFLPLNAKQKLNFASRTNCGPQWYSPEQKGVAMKVVERRNIDVAPGRDNLYQALKKAKSGDVLLLANGEYVNTKKITVNGNIVIKAKESQQRPVIRMEVSSETSVMFELSGGSYLELNGVALDGMQVQNKPVKYAFATTKLSGSAYSLILDNCEVYGFQNENGGAVMRAYKGTFADSIVVRNSHIRDSYRGFALNDEKEDKGAYSAQYVIFENAVFSHIAQWALDYYRGGIDDSTLGGTLLIDHCVFDCINDRENQVVIRQTGIKNISIRNSIFSNSSAKNPIRLIGKYNQMTNCNLYLCGKATATQGATLESIFTENPKYVKKQYLLSPKSALIGKGCDGGNIGLK